MAKVGQLRSSVDQKLDPKYKIPTSLSDLILVRFSDGSAHHLQTAVVLQHKVEPQEEGSHARRQIGVPILEEEARRPQVSDDRCEAEGDQAEQTRREVKALSATQEGLQGLRRSAQPQGRPREDCARFPH